MVLEKHNIQATTTLLLLLCKSPVQQLGSSSILLNLSTISDRHIGSTLMPGRCYTPLSSCTFPTSSDTTLPGCAPPLVSPTQAEILTTCNSNRADPCSLLLERCLTLTGHYKRQADKFSLAVLTVARQHDLLKLSQSSHHASSVERQQKWKKTQRGRGRDKFSDS